MANHHMIQYAGADHVQSVFEGGGQGPIGLAGFWVTGGMIVNHNDGCSIVLQGDLDHLSRVHARAICGFHAIRPPSPRSSGQAFHGHLATCSTAIRPGSRSAATQGWHC